MATNFRRVIGTSLCLACAMPAVAQTDWVTVNIKVKGLNLQELRDRRVLDLRIVRAARLICDTESERMGISVRRAQRACHEQVAKEVWAKLEGRPAVPAIAR